MTGAETSTGRQAVPFATRVLRNRTYRTVGLVYVVLIVLIIASRAISPSFGSFGFAKTVVALGAFTAVVAFGQYVVVLTGGLDLSIPGVMTIAAAFFTGISLGDDSRAWWVLILVLAIGAGIGAINGLGVVYLKLSPVVMTLAINVILSGVVLVYTQGTPKGGVPDSVVNAVQGKTLGGTMPTIIIMVIVFTIIGSLLINQTVFGRWVYTVGSNRQAALLSGVPVNGVTIGVYAISGLCAALGGILLAGYGSQSFLNLGDPYLLLSLAAVVVGGVSILGGRGLYLGVLAGAVILTTISSALAGTSLPDAVKQIIYAVTIVVAVVAARSAGADTES